MAQRRLADRRAAIHSTPHPAVDLVTKLLNEHLVEHGKHMQLHLGELLPAVESVGDADDLLAQTLYQLAQPQSLDALTRRPADLVDVEGRNLGVRRLPL